MQLVLKEQFKVLALTILMVVISLSVSAHGEDTLTGSFTNDLYLNPQTSSLITYRSDLEVTYYLKDMRLSLSSVFTEDSYHSQKFGLDYSLGLLDTYSTLSYDPDNSRINYFKGEADTVLSGIGIENTFVLEYLEDEEVYGSGYELTLYGKIPDGPSLYVDNLFGMEDNEAELLGLVDGSGYTIQTGS
ncbi:hypothetical protein KGY64_03840, partial [Candidatus Bipolaricaulota bacterium]|nr:hypothetical protein [Candidatus Bipolaricaulota bacterium]